MKIILLITVLLFGIANSQPLGVTDVFVSSGGIGGINCSCNGY